MRRERLIESMFHRRLVLLGAGMLVIVMMMGSQLVRLAVVEGAERLQAAEQRLERTTIIPTYRGRIVDRNNMVLAVDRASYDIAVDYSVITGDWEREQATHRAMREIGRGNWYELDESERVIETQKWLAHYQATTDRLWAMIQHLGGITHDEVVDRKDEIKRTVQTMAAAVWEAQREARRRELKLPEGQPFDFSPRPIREQKSAHVILSNVRDELSYEFLRVARELPGLIEVHDTRVRDYPWSTVDVVLDRSTLPLEIRSDAPATIRVQGVADHILGSMREVWKGDIDRLPLRDQATGAIANLKGYAPENDSVGARGLEQTCEALLRGTRGRIDERRDTGEQLRVDPEPGSDVRTTLDIKLQARVQAILEPDFGLTRTHRWHEKDEVTQLPLGTPLNSAAVVIEVSTGEVLCMISKPTIADGLDMTDQQQQVHQPWANRAVEAVYPPGSIIKPLVLVCAMADGKYDLSEAIECTGHFFPHAPNIGRCWIYRPPSYMTHEPLHGAGAIARSCNIFFYTLADRLGMSRLTWWYRQFGLGSPLDVGLLYRASSEDGIRRLGESAGMAPSERDVDALRARGELDFSTIIMGIGQGPVAWSPVQAANAYATLARGGIVRDATLLADHNRVRLTEARPHLNLPATAVRAALQGLREGVNERYGSSNRINYPNGDSEPIMNAKGVTVWAKTGTAQAPALRREVPVDTDGDGELEQFISGLDHAWCVALVGPEGTDEPLYAISVIVEYGGSGGRAAGPIVNQIVHALQAEGYLPGGAP